ncbi:MAG: hypothetical protein ABSC20_07685 [Candidatus Bathyarchaeia archaeon]
MAKRKLSITTAVVTLVIIGIALALTTFAAITTSTTVPATGTVTTSAGLAVYSNSACTTSLSSINWGTLTAGGTTTQTIYVKNTSTGLSLSLNMTTSGWSPASANGPITVTWNPQSTDLQPGASTAATLTLTVSSSISDITSFSVNINIGGTNP